jgi:hypothetical protein
VTGSTLCIRLEACGGKLGETAPEPIVFETEGVTYATVDLTRAVRW